MAVGFLNEMRAVPDHRAAGGAQIVIDSESVIIQPDVAEANRPKPAVVPEGGGVTPRACPSRLRRFLLRWCGRWWCWWRA
jgi:hypothetical protein